MDNHINKVLSVIVPSYNVGKTLPKTLSSMLNCKSADKLEIIVVNDGSRDHTLEIGNKFQKEYPEIIKIINKENGGHGSTINTGISLATGKYFKVVDGDDWLKSENLDKYIFDLSHSDADIIINPYIEVNDSNRNENEITINVGIAPSGKTLSFDSVAGSLDLPMHSISFRKEMLSGVNIDEHCFYVDVEYVLFPTKNINTIEFYDYPIYKYRVFSANQSMAISNLQKNVNQHKRVLHSLVEYYKNERSHLSKEKQIYILKRLSTMYKSQQRIFYSFDYNRALSKDIYEEQVYIKKECPEILPYLTGLRGLIFKSNPRILYDFWWMVIRLRRRILGIEM